LKIMGTKIRGTKMKKSHRATSVAGTNNPFHILPPGDAAPDNCNAVIECPMRSKIKYELDKTSGFMQISRVLHSAVHYPSNYGFIPQTYCEDRDPLDILVLSQEPVTPGCIMKARPIGMLRMVDQNLEDIKIIAAHANDPFYENYNDISQLPPHMLREIRHFFEIYKELEKGKNPIVGDFNGRVDAHKAIRDAMNQYQRHRNQLLQGKYPDV
jgi:inorganic pyrophosphatase